MSKELIESIIDDNLVSANDIFAEHMNTILERKLYENKRMMQVEVVTPVKGKPGQFKGQNTKADWARYRKSRPHFGAFDVPDKEGKPVKVKTTPKEKTASGGITKHGMEVRRKKGYVKAYPALKGLEFIKAVARYHRTGKIDEGFEDLRIGREYAAASKDVEQSLKAGKRPEPTAFGMTGKRGRKGKAAAPEAEAKPVNRMTAGMSQAGQAAKQAGRLKITSGMSQAGREREASQKKVEPGTRPDFAKMARQKEPSALNVGKMGQKAMLQQKWSGVKGPTSATKPNPRHMNIVSRYMTDRAKAKELAAAGNRTALKTLDKAYGAKRLPALGVAVAKKVGSGLADFGREVGSLGE